MLFWLNLEGLVGFGHKLISRKNIPGVWNSMINSMEVGMHRANTGTFISRNEETVLWYLVGSCGRFSTRTFHTSCLTLTGHESYRLKKNKANYSQVWFSFSLDNFSLPSGNAAHFWVRVSISPRFLLFIPFHFFPMLSTDIFQTLGCLYFYCLWYMCLMCCEREVASYPFDRRKNFWASKRLNHLAPVPNF